MFIYLIITVIILIYWLITRKQGYWEKRKVAHKKPTFLFGNYGDLVLIKRNYGQLIQNLCEQFPNEPYIGAFFVTEPVLIPTDPEIIKIITTKNFYYFNGREIADHSYKDGSSESLFSAHGDNWKVLRQNLTPLFTSSKMKNMFHLIEKCSRELETMLDRETSSKDVHEIRTCIANFTMACITECAFGIHSNTMGPETSDNPFSKMAKFFGSNRIWSFYKRLVRAVWPSIYFLFVNSRFKEQMAFFHHMITTVMNQRGYKSSGRNDFVDLVMGWKQNKEIFGDSMKNVKTGANEKISVEVNDSLLVSQCFTFFAAGFETSATTSSYTLYELAKHKEAQQKVFEEIDAYLASHNNQLEYDCITELPYLEACIDEALRLYPVLSMIPRETLDECVLPGGLKVEKGLRVHLPVYFMHHNPKYFEDPEEYHPERFYGEAKKNIIPYTYMPFGEGPRTCIGMRFAKMQMMAGFITLLKKYRLELPDDMPKKLSFIPQAFMTQPMGGIRVKLLKRDGWENRVYTRN